MALQQNQVSNDERQVLRHVYVKDFIRDDEDNVIGVHGLTWPDRLPVNVVLDNECEKAKNAKRMTFAKLANGFKVHGQKFQLKPGAILRMRTLAAGQQDGDVLYLKTDWINVVSYNREQTDKSIKFGLVIGKTRTPAPVWEKREEIRKSQAFNAWLAGREKDLGRKIGRREYNRELEKRLAAAMPGQLRYYGQYFVYNPDGIRTTGDPQILRKALVDYFNDPDFTVRKSEDGNSYRPIKPHLIIRGLNHSGEYARKRLEFMPQDAEVLPRDKDGKAIPDAKSFKAPEECAEEVMANLPKGCASWSILPAKVYTHSLIQMEMSKPGEGSMTNEYAMAKIYELNADCHKKNERGDVQPMAFSMGLRLSPDDERPCVVETMRDYRVEALDPVMVMGVKRSQVPGQMNEYVLLKSEPEPAPAQAGTPEEMYCDYDNVSVEDDGPYPF